MSAPTQQQQQQQHDHRRPRDEQDNEVRQKRARATMATTTATTAPTPPTAEGAASERHLASVAVRTLLPPDTNQAQQAPTVSKPMQLGCWTKLSRLSGLPKERRFLYGDRSGLPRLALPPPSRLPLSLDEGYPDRFVRKPEGEPSGVEAVVRGAQHPSTAPSPTAVLEAAKAATAGGGGEGGTGGGGASGEPAPLPGGGIDWSFINVVTYRNNLNKILCVPIDASARADGWCIDAVLLTPPGLAQAAATGGGANSQPAPPHRVLFLDIQPDPGGERTFPGQDRFMYYGYKLETICTEQQDDKSGGGGGGSGGGGGGEAKPQQQQQPPPLVDSTSEYGTLVAVRLGRHRVLMAAEIDAEEGAEDGAPPRLAEIKCYRPPPPAAAPPAPAPHHHHAHGGRSGRGRGNNPNRAAETLFRLKHQRWWVQSFLAGVPTLVLGSRDDRGNLVGVQKVPVARLAEISGRHGFPWSGDRLVAFGDAALAWMRSVAEREAEEGSHLRFRYDPRAGEVRAWVVEGGDLPARVSRALAERGAGVEA